ncbi:MAG TPA: anthranilate phosphoribosyltransferase [Pirellulaceae bacterium]|nr:anthranilate phosphoribosyltransferase [Pirellulaceae bacterium]
MSNFSLTNYLGRVASGQDLSMAEMADVIDHVMQGQCAENAVAVLLTALRAKGESVDEIAGAAQAMRKHMTPIRHSRAGVVDTCGTGGIGSEVFNISTAAAIVTAAAGVPVAKHGNKSITSKSGSADVLAELGVNVAAAVPVVERCLEELGICFCFAPHMHPAMKHVAPIRKKLGFGTIFNLLGPLCNPAGAPYQLLGVGRSELREKIAAALSRLGIEQAVVVSGEDGLGEVTLSGATLVIKVRGTETSSFTWRPEDFGLAPAGRETMLISGPAESAGIIRRVLSGERGPCHDIVVLNAAAALWTTGIDPSPAACAERAGEAIDSGKGLELLRRWVALSSAL